MSSDPAQLRREYTQGGLDRGDLDPDPIAQFRVWYDQAVKEGLLEANAMSLATADSEGRPRVRTVLLKGLDQRGFVFFTNYESTKARHIAENPQVSLMFAWLPFERQVIVTGTARKISSAESLRYFASRPLGSRLGAWVSPQSQVITSRSVLEMKLDEMKRKFAHGKIPLPSFWGGYRVEPESVEFWQGRRNRLHDRFLYTRKESSDKDAPATWDIERLAP